MGDLILTVTGDSFSSYNSTPFTFTGDSLSVDWGDGTTETYTSGQLTHTYSTSGTYTIIITGNITSIGNLCFFQCTGLTRVTIPNTVTSIGSGCFEECTGLTRVTIPNSITTIGWGCFYNCTGLTSITIPNSITTIGNSCFNGCTGLTRVTIPNSITTIGDYCFSRCSGLENIVFEPSTPPSIGNSAFNSVPTSCVVHVPTGSLSTYTSAENYPSTSLYTYVEYDLTPSPTPSGIFDGVTSVVIKNKVVKSMITTNGGVLYEANTDALSLSSNKTILSYYDNESATLTATLTGSDKVGQTVNLYDNDTNVLIGAMTDNLDGTYSYIYESQGKGEITFKAVHNNSMDTVTIEDCIDYDPCTSANNKWSVPSSYSINSYSSKGWTFGQPSSYTHIPYYYTPTIPFEVEFEIKNIGTHSYGLDFFFTSSSNDYITFAPSSIRVATNNTYDVNISPIGVWNIKIYSNKIIVYKNGEFIKESPLTNSTPSLKWGCGSQSGRWATIKDFKIKGIPVEVDLTSTKSIISSCDDETTTLTTDIGVTGETIQLYANNKYIGNMTDEEDGSYSYTYTATGKGEITFKAVHNNSMDTVTIEDCYVSHTAEITMISSHSSDTASYVWNDFSFTGDDFSIEFDMKSSGGGIAFGVEPKTYIPTMKQHMTMGYSSSGGYLNYYIGKESSGEDYYTAVSSPSLSTYYSCKITKQGNEIKFYLNDVLKGTYTRTFLNGKEWTFIFSDWKTGKTANAKNIKIKAL